MDDTTKTDASFICKFDGVVDQVAENLPNPSVVSFHHQPRNIGRQFNQQFNLFVLQLAIVALVHLQIGEEIGQIYYLLSDNQLIGFNHTDIDNVVDQLQ